MCATPYLDGLVTAAPYQRVHDKVYLDTGPCRMEDDTFSLMRGERLCISLVCSCYSWTHFSEHLALDCTWKYLLFAKIMMNSVASRNACTGPKLNLGTTQSPACPALCSKMNGPPLQGGDTSDVFLFCANILEKHRTGIREIRMCRFTAFKGGKA